MSCRGDSQDNAKSSVDGGGLLCEVSEGTKDYQGHLCDYLN